MSAESALLNLIEKLMPKAATISVGTVISVDKENRTCDVERDGQPDLFNCRLNAVIDSLDSHVTCFPASGSYVLCITLDDPTDCLIIASTAVDEIDIKVGQSSILINKTDIVLNDGALGGMVKITEFTNKLNELVTTHNIHTHPVATTGTAAAQSGTAAPTTAPASNFVASDYENEKIKQ